MTDKELLKKLIKAVTARNVDYLREEAGLEVSEVRHTLQNLKWLTLSDLTSLVGIGGALGMYVAFSFDNQVIRRIFEIYTRGLEVQPEMEPVYIEETAGDVVNTIIGNALADFPDNVPAITLTPPIVMSEAKRISRHKDAYFYMSSFVTGSGKLNIMYIGPKDLFDENLDYKE